MFTKILCVAVLFCAQGDGSADFFDIERDLGISHAKVKPFYGCETPAFPPNKSSLVPTFTIDLALQPRQRWTELVLANKDALVAMVGHVYNLTEAVMGETAVRFLLHHIGKIVDSLPSVYREELEGIAEASGLELDQITFYNIFYEIFSFCTSIVMQDAQGELYHGRNLDFGLFLGWNNATHEWKVAEMLRPLVAQLEWRNSTAVVYTSVTFAGYIGVVTANKPGVFSFSVNERFSWNGGYVGLVEWIIFGDHNQRWLALLTREVLLEAVSYDDAVQRLSSPRLVAPVYFTLAGTLPGQGCIITRYRDNYDLLKIGSRDYISTWYLVQTNYDHWKSPPFFDDRRTPAVTCLDSGRNSSVVVGQEALLSDLHANVAAKPHLRPAVLPQNGGDSNQRLEDAGVVLSSDASSLGSDVDSGKDGFLASIKRGALRFEDVIARYWRAGFQEVRHFMGYKDTSSETENVTSPATPVTAKRVLRNDQKANPREGGMKSMDRNEVLSNDQETNPREGGTKSMDRNEVLSNDQETNPREGGYRVNSRPVEGDVNKESLSLLYSVLSTRPVLNKLTTYTTLMSAKKGYIQSWLRWCPDPCWPW